MALKEDKMLREAEGGDSYDPEGRSSPKPASRVDTLVSSVLLCTYAVSLLAEALEEGPLRTKVKELASTATENAKQARFDPLLARRRRSRRR